MVSEDFRKRLTEAANGKTYDPKPWIDSVLQVRAELKEFFKEHSINAKLPRSENGFYGEINDEYGVTGVFSVECSTIEPAANCSGIHETKRVYTIEELQDWLVEAVRNMRRTGLI